MGARTNGPRMDVASKGPGEGTHIAVAGQTEGTYRAGR